MNINKKYIIIFGTLILSLVVIVGAIIYYNEKTEENTYGLIPIPGEERYLIWCHYEENVRYDCSDQEFFKPGELIDITVNFTQFDDVPVSPNDLYILCYQSDLIEGSEKQCTPDTAYSSLTDFTLEEGIVPEDKAIFTLLKLTIVPENNFEEVEETIIMDLTGKLIK